MKDIGGKSSETYLMEVFMDQRKKKKKEIKYACEGFDIICGLFFSF